MEVPKTVSQDRIQQRTVEIVDAPVPQVVEETGGELKGHSLAEMIVEVLVIQTQGRTQQGVNTHVQHVVNVVEVERPKPSSRHGRKPSSRSVQKVTEIPLLQCIDEANDGTVVQVPRVQVVEKTVEGPTVASFMFNQSHIM